MGGGLANDINAATRRTAVVDAGDTATRRTAAVDVGGETALAAATW